jgi:putative transposase
VRGINRAPCFLESRDFLAYRAWFLGAAAAHGSDVHAYVFMTNHVHALMTGHRDGAISATMQDVGRRYVRYFNDVHGRSGPLFEGRFRSALVATDDYVLACIRYIDLNPVRAGMVDDPASYPWSTCAAHARQEAVDGWTPHAAYVGLAAQPDDRARAYRAMLELPIPDQTLEDLRAPFRRRNSTRERDLMARLMAEVPPDDPGSDSGI